MKYILSLLGLLSLLLLTACQNQPANQPATVIAPAEPVDQVVPVKLCPGTPSYPSVFVEYALCIESQLYGVYSANDGFLALLPPGNYASNAIGSSCNFTVALNCVVY